MFIRVLVSAIAVTLLTAAPGAHAAPQVDQDRGTWLDTYRDALGIVPAASGATTNVAHDFSGRLVTIETTGADGLVETTSITPTSSFGWRDLSVTYTAATENAVVVSAVDPATGTVYPLTLGPGEGAFTAVADLSGVPASVGSLRVRLALSDAPILPTLQALRVRWHPKSVLAGALAGAATACTNDTKAFRANVSVSIVEAIDLVVYAPIAEVDGVRPAASAMSDGGRYTATAITVGATTVPAFSVYWHFPITASGTTFALTYNLSYANGTANGAVFANSLHVDAANADVIVAPRDPTTIESAPSPFLQKSAGRTFYLSGQHHAIAGDPLTFYLSGGNFRYTNKRCGEPYRGGVIYDTITPLMPYAATGDVTSFDFGDGTFTAAGDTVEGVAVPANSVYWVVGDLPIHGRFSRSFTMQTADDSSINDGDLMTNTAALRHGAARAQADAVHPIEFGVPDDPRGFFALGDTVAGLRRIRVFENDNADRQAGYGQLVSFNPLTSNRGASTLNDVVMITAIPTGTTFDAASINAAGATILYSTTAGDLASPPGHSGTSAQFDNSWSTSPPADPGAVTFVAFVVDTLASTFFPIDGVSTSAVGDVRVRIDLPATECPESTIVAQTSFEIMGYTRIGATTPIAGPGVAGAPFVDTEPIGVLPTRPDLGNTVVVAQDRALVPGGAANYTVAVRNQSGTTAPIDTALDVEAVLTLPRVNVNGNVRNLSCTVTDAAGASVDYSNAPVSVTLTWPVLEAGGQRLVQVGCASPIGIVNGSSATLSAAVTAFDDVCGPVNRLDADTTTYSGPQRVQLTKTVDFSVVSPGSEIVYTMGISNTGVVPAVDTWVVDRVPAGTTFLAAQAPPGSIVWFASTAPPTLPAALSAIDRFTTVRIAQHFRPGVAIGDGWFVPEGGATPLWMAFEMDDTTLTPPMVRTGGAVTAAIKVRADSDKITGDILTNEAAILTASLLQAIGEQTRTVISTLPSLHTVTECSPVVSLDEPVTITVTYRNDSTNDDDQVVVTVALPDEVTYTPSAAHVFDASTAAAHPGASQVTVEVDGQSLRFDITAALGAPLAKGEGGTITIEAAVASGIVSGTQALTTATGLAINAAGGLEQETACITLVENADVGLVKAVDQAAPRSGEGVTFTLLARNDGAHAAVDAILVDPLPAGLTYVPGSARVLVAGWSLTELAPVDGAHRWQLVSPAADGAFPGRTGPIVVLLEAMVDADVAPGTTLENCATITTVTAEDDNALNTGCVTMTTPLPDPWIRKVGPSLVAPSEPFSYTLTYGNRAREDAAGMVVIDRIPDGPVPAANATPDVTVRGVSLNNGETAWFLDGDLADEQPVIDPANPAAGGWTQDPTSLPRVTHVAIVVGDLPALSGPYSILVDVVAQDPTGLPPLSGAQLDNVATIGSYSTPPTLDEDDSNNRATAMTRTPGIDLSSRAVCEPSGALPGLRPGDLLNVTLALRNTGTVEAYGLKLALTLPNSVTLEADGTGVIATDTTPVDTGDGVLVAPLPRLEDAAGADSAFVDPQGDTVSSAIRWVREDTTLYLGDRGEATASEHYRRVGLAPGAVAYIALSLRVSDALGDDEVVTIGAMADTDYRFDWVGTPVEEIRDNNASDCNTSIYRADVFVTKEVANLDGDDSLAAAGDRLRYTIEYGNAGHFAASDVILQDALPAGTHFLVGSVANLFSDAVIVEYDAGTLRWDYQPTAADGEPDPAVTAFRVRWKDPLGAPANAVFAQDSAASFAPSTLVSAVASVNADGVVPAASGIESSFACQPGQVQCEGTRTNIVSPNMCNNTFRLDVVAGDCCMDCADNSGIGDVETCDAPACPDSPETCDLCTSEATPFDDDDTPCLSTLQTTYEAWASCVASNGAAACAQLEMADAWAACELPTECPAVADDSCDRSLIAFQLGRLSRAMFFHYDSCLALTGDAAHCAGWIPSLEWPACTSSYLEAICPEPEANRCYWYRYNTRCTQQGDETAALHLQCVERLGEAACTALKVPNGCAACVEQQAPQLPQQAACKVDGFL
ncbi:MAG: putative repeat protein (TIGR01451 family), partial [Myxococcota bacterium]